MAKTNLITLIVSCILLSTLSCVHAYLLTFNPEMSISTEYTDNLFLSEDHEENDLITIFSPSFNLHLEDRHHGLDFSYSPSYSMYKNWSENNTWRHSLDLFGWIDISAHTRFEIDNAFLRTEDPLEEEDVYLPDNEPLVQTDATRERGRSTYWTNTTRFNLTHQFGRDNSYFIRYIHGIRKTNDPEDEDHTRESPSIGLTYWFGPRWGLETELGYTSTKYSGGEGSDQSDDFEEWDWSIRLNRRFSRHFQVVTSYSLSYTDYDGEEEDYRDHSLTAGIDYDMSRHTSISLEAGYFIHDYEESEDETGMVFDTSIDHTFRRGSLHFSGAVGQEESHYGAEALGMSEYYEVECSAGYQLTRRITADISAYYRKDMYKDEDPERDDKTKRFSIEISWQCRDWLVFSTTYSYNAVDSTEREEEYRENRFVFQITITPPRPYRF